MFRWLHPRAVPRYGTAAMSRSCHPGSVAGNVSQLGASMGEIDNNARATGLSIAEGKKRWSRGEGEVEKGQRV
jgi:hypothetical protein